MAIDASDINRMAGRSVQAFPGPDGGVSNYFVIAVGGIADTIQPWGTGWITRDRQLREFYLTEPWVASTVASIAARNAAFSWTLEGPPRTCDRIQEMLHTANYGGGWVEFVEKLTTDLLTQDNGAFVEIIRESDSPTAPVLGLANLDSGQCVRTGNLEIPVIYTDRQGAQHKMQWYQIVDFTDNPSPIERMNGIGFCAVSRVLREAQKQRDILIYLQEKASGRNPARLHVVSGASTKELTDALHSAAEHRDNQGLTRYQPPVVMGTVDPTAEVRLVTIDLKSLPDGWDPEKDSKWYIAVLALGFGCEYQDLAPLPGGGLGTSTQSQVLHLKARGKGPELFQKMVEHKLNFYILPRNVQYKFDEKDYEAMGVEVGVRKSRAETRAVRIQSGEITPAIARQIAEDEGDLKHEYLQAMSEQDLTQNTQVQDEQIEQEPEQVEAIEAGPNEPPEDEEEQAPPQGQKHAAGRHDQSTHGSWAGKRTGRAGPPKGGFKRGDYVVYDNPRYGKIPGRVLGTQGPRVNVGNAWQSESGLWFDENKLTLIRAPAGTQRTPKRTPAQQEEARRRGYKDEEPEESEMPDAEEKAFDADAWERKRASLEREYTDEIEAILGDIEKQVVKRVREEVNAEEAQGATGAG